jgi:hypothetical protein
VSVVNVVVCWVELLVNIVVSGTDGRVLCWVDIVVSGTDGRVVDIVVSGTDGRVVDIVVSGTDGEVLCWVDTVVSGATGGGSVIHTAKGLTKKHGKFHDNSVTLSIII